MIRVNLLPPEYRKAEATPMKQFFATMGAAVLAALALVAWGYIHFQVLDPRRQTLQRMEDEIVSQKPQVEMAKALKAQLGEYTSRYETIDEVAKGRLVWSRKLDELWEVLVAPRLPGRYEVWIKDLSCTLTAGKGKAAKGKGPPSGGTSVFSGTSAGAPMHKLADFHEDLQASDYFKDYLKISPPVGSRETLSTDRDPGEGWNFKFTLALKPLDDIYAGRQGGGGKPKEPAPPRPGKGKGKPK